MSKLPQKVRFQNRKGPVCFPRQVQGLDWTQTSGVPPWWWGREISSLLQSSAVTDGQWWSRSCWQDGRCGTGPPGSPPPCLPQPGQVYHSQSLSFPYHLLHHLPRLVLHVPVPVPGHKERVEQAVIWKHTMTCFHRKCIKLVLKWFEIMRGP